MLRLAGINSAALEAHGTHYAREPDEGRQSANAHQSHAGPPVSAQPREMGRGKRARRDRVLSSRPRDQRIQLGTGAISPRSGPPNTPHVQQGRPARDVRGLKAPAELLRRAPVPRGPVQHQPAVVLRRHGHVRRREPRPAEVSPVVRSAPGASADGVPFVGPLPGLPGQWVCAGHSGHGMARIFTAAPGLVKLMNGKSWAETQLPDVYQITQERMERLKK
ncbi:hypothetical protein BP5796_11900 [Coleophoma crateriformis]|uniref:FAD dependent oxidoreductase domain-containing protein n=1 Tax=Coleophoma crateriformis TaxID=565419 RepID=A0A3D8QFV2_9HELO|nr:hypothetical protein BP5796_11900 [Coleophoma crateriformis]